MWSRFTSTYLICYLLFYLIIYLIIIFQNVSTESFCKNKQLFSPVKEQSPNPFITFSTDSLDCSDDMLITCKANNKHNYTIAFEEPPMGVSEEFQNSEAMSTEESRNTGSGEAWSSDGSVPVSAPMISSDTTFITWNKFKKCTTSATTNGTQKLKEVIIKCLLYMYNMCRIIQTL